MDQKGRNKQGRNKSLAVKRSMYGYILTYSRLRGRTFKLCVLTRWDFNFCVRSSPLRDRKRYIVERTNKAEIRLGDQSEKAESCQEELWNEIQVKGPEG